MFRLLPSRTSSAEKKTGTYYASPSKSSAEKRTEVTDIQLNWIPSKAGLKEVDLDMSIMPIHDQHSSLIIVHSFAGIWVESRLEPLLQHQAVDPAALRHLRQLSHVISYNCCPALLKWPLGRGLQEVRSHPRCQCRR